MGQPESKQESYPEAEFAGSAPPRTQPAQGAQTAPAARTQSTQNLLTSSTGYPNGPPPTEAIPYTNYSVEKTPEKAEREKGSGVRKAQAPVVHAIADDPFVEKFKRLPSFVPVINSSKKAYDELDPKGIYSMLLEIHTYYSSHAEFLSRESAKASQSIVQMDLACLKAKSLAVQHYKDMTKLIVAFPNVEQMCNQVTQTHATINKIKDSLANLESIFEQLESRTAGTLTPSSSSGSLSSLSSHSSFTFLDSDDTAPVVVVPIRKSKVKSKHESPYWTAKPRGAKPNSMRASISEGMLPAHSPPAATPLEVWTANIIPRWKELKVRETPWVRSMWKSGIPKDVRGQVWRLAIEDKLNLSPELFEKLVEESEQMKEEPEVQKTHREIDVDVNRTFASAGDINEFRHKMVRVLRAYSRLKVEMGYVQGMSYIVGMFLHYMNDYEFVCMSNLLENKFLNGLFRLDIASIEQYISVFGSLLSQLEPKLDKHFNEMGLIPQHYLLQWWLPMYSKSLPLEICSRIWDCFLLEGEIFCFVASLGILRMYRKYLKEMDMESCKKLLSNLPDDIPEEDLFSAIESIPAPLYNTFLDRIHDKPS